MKGMIIVLALLLVSGIVNVYAATPSDTCAMTVTVSVSKSVIVTGEPLAFPGVSAADTTGVVTSAAATVTSDASTTQDYNLQITGKPSGWSVEEAAGNPGNETFKLFAMFASGTPVAGDFSDASAEDVVKLSGTTNATADVYAKNDQGADVKGTGCTATSVRKLWFRYVPPASTVLTTQQMVTVTVTAF